MTGVLPLLSVVKGTEISYLGGKYVITNVIALDKVLAKNLDSGTLETLPIAELRPSGKEADDRETQKNIDLQDVSSEDWEIARHKLELIKPLLRPGAWGSAVAARIAEQSDITLGTLYRWRRDYLDTGLLSSLLPVKREGGRGKARLQDPTVEKIIADNIDNYYKTDAHPTVAATLEKIRIECEAAGLKVPHYQTVRRRVVWSAGREMTAARYGEKAARELHDAIEGQIPDADWPLGIVQIDHTPCRSSSWMMNCANRFCGRGLPFRSTSIAALSRVCICR
ncbi:protein of unknown function [Georgfuchsia toluolica]|uniref:Transposase n=1 Tax=Georgfuchsia toluolica TaxID=424218 RepID=A0A916N9L8_9PROT|nr:hypothetical protein [Georgfuchsia toluolica]CAG4884757.1 protein of unknown function [Georgfuchsia toluolica]